MIQNRGIPPLAEAAYQGLAGELVRLIEPHTEADPTAILTQFLMCFGNVIGRGAWCKVEADRHHLNLFACLVGESSKSRKGTSLGHVKKQLADVDPAWRTRIMGGLSSGEGMIWAVRDPITKQEPKRDPSPQKPAGDYQKEILDPGVEDKRLLVVEAEFANVLKVMARVGNNLSAQMRQAWDGGDLGTLTKNSPATATGAHISVIGHITRDELRRYLDRTEAASGFGNRFVWVCVSRSKCLPDGGKLQEVNLDPFLTRLKQAVEFGKSAGEITRDPEAAGIWREVYSALSDDKPGLAGALTARAEAQVLRLSAIYAVLDQTRQVRPEHLAAALALWDYAEASVKSIFGQTVGDPMADQILAAMQNAPEGLSRTTINNLLGRHANTGRIQTALASLQRDKLAAMQERGTEGRPAEIWTAISAK